MRDCVRPNNFGIGVYSCRSTYLQVSLPRIFRRTNFIIYSRAIDSVLFLAKRCRGRVHPRLRRTQRTHMMGVVAKPPEYHPSPQQEPISERRIPSTVGIFLKPVSVASSFRFQGVLPVSRGLILILSLMNRTNDRELSCPSRSTQTIIRGGEWRLLRTN